MPHPQSNTLVGVQVLRGVAAMLVVFAHATQMVHERFGSGDVYYFGASGVDIFFPISGFVMVVTTYRHWGKIGQWAPFLLRRIVRIVPLYWAATLLKAIATAAFPQFTSHPVLDPWHVTASFLFIPAWDADHKPLPLLPVGWTLHFEMLFYALFTLALALRLRPVWWISGLLLAVAVLPAPTALGAIGSLFSPMLLEFVFGMLIGWATVSGRRINFRLATVALPLSLLALCLTQLLPESIGFTYRLGLWGIPGAIALLSTVALEAPCRARLNGWPALLGDASYAIYLMHGFVLPVVGVLMLKLHLDSGAWKIVAVLAGCVGSALAGVVTHLWMEKPLTDILNRRVRQMNTRPLEQGGT